MRRLLNLLLVIVLLTLLMGFKPQETSTAIFTVSYTNSAAWLDDLAPEDRDDQILDWAVWGLAGLLKLDTETLRNAVYDQTPLRNPLLTDATNNRVGPGRGLPDGKGTLHLLAPADSGPYAARAIGMVLDDYYKDTGIDPDQIIIYWYTIDYKMQHVILKSEDPRPTQAIRSNYGYHDMLIDSVESLQRFLEKTQHLSQLRLRGGQLWAGGWNWPGVPDSQITVEDLTVLQQGYRKAAAGQSTEPGFSLDPGQPLKVSELLSILKLSRYQDIVDFVVALKQADTLEEKHRLLSSNVVTKKLLGEREAQGMLAFLESTKTEAELEAKVTKYTDIVLNEVATILTNALANDHSRLGTTPDQTYDTFWQLIFDTMDGEPPYQVARYDGGLQGTEAGMTYFYTDLVAKAWRQENGSGTPVGKVPGFISDVQAKTPWGQCTTHTEKGRIWFGLREGAISIGDDRINLGSIATRVFTLIRDPQLGDQEVEPSYRFGRLIWWWDRHYQAMADYEPQYHRLDQLMRWGAALAWLVEQNKALLPEMPVNKIKTDWKFGDWLAAHPELKWHFDIPFIVPPTEKSEALLTLYSKGLEDCGTSWIWSGGISNPAIKRIFQIKDLQPVLPPEVARAGLSKFGTTFASVDDIGVIANLDNTVQQTLNPIVNNLAKVDVVVNSDKVWSLGKIKAWVNELVPRKISMELSSETGSISQKLAVQGTEVGELSVKVDATIATVKVEPGPLARLNKMINSIQENLGISGRTLKEAVANSKVNTVAFQDPEGRILIRLDDPVEVRWAAIEKGTSLRGEEMGFGLNAPGDEGLIPYTAYFDDGPKISSSWLEVQSGQSGSPAMLQVADPPSAGAQKFIVHSAQNKQTGFFTLDEGHVLVQADDPILGLNGTKDGINLVSQDTLKLIADAKQATLSGGDDYARAIALPDDSVVLAHGDDLTLVTSESPWHQRVQAVLEQGKGDDSLLFKLSSDHDQALLVEKVAAQKVEQQVGAVDLSDFMDEIGPLFEPNARGPPVYLEGNLANQILVEGRIPPGGIDHGIQVRVVRVEVTPGSLSKIEPDLVSFGKTEWVHPAESAYIPDTESLIFIFPIDVCEEAENDLRCEEK